MAPDTSVDSVILRARDALHPGRLDPSAWWRAAGTGENLGVNARYSLLFGPGGEFALRADAVFCTAFGFDGSRGWLQDSTGMPRGMETPELALWRLVAAVLSGAWTDLPPDAFLDVRHDPSTGILLRVDPGGGNAPATLELDPESFHCKELVCQRPFGLEEWRLAFGEDPRLPVHVEQVLPGGFRNTIDIQSVSRADPEERRYCAFPQHRPDDAEWRAGVAANLRVERGPGGFLMVPVRLNGATERSFVIDSGAAVNVIDRKAAEADSLRQIGHSWMPTASGSGPSPRWRAESIDIGPLGLRGLWFTELDLTALSHVCGTAIAGILGYDLFQRCVVELDLQTPAIALFDPTTYSPGEKTWLPLSLYSNRPHVKARFGAPSGETGEGLFRLDTGAPKVAVLFNTPVTARFALASAPDMKSVRIPLPGGEMETAIGPIPWFELGGRRSENVRAICVVTQGTGFADPVCAGNLGQVLFENRRLTFDYSNARLALNERPQPAS